MSCKIYPRLTPFLCMVLLVSLLSAHDHKDVKCDLVFYKIKPKVVFSRASADQMVAPLELKELFFKSRGKWVDVSSESDKFSETYTYRGAPELELFDSLPDDDADTSSAIASVPISHAWRKAVVLLYPGVTGEDGPAFKASCQEWKILEEGSLRLVNLVGEAVEIEIDETPINLAPNQNYDFNLKYADEPFLSVKMFLLEEGQRKMAYSTKLSINNDVGMMALIKRVSPDSSRLRLSTSILSEAMR